ncbi:MAG: DUF4367 domain-containing protein [Candidatus Saccharimonadales bacterium]
MGKRTGARSTNKKLTRMNTTDKNDGKSKSARKSGTGRTHPVNHAAVHAQNPSKTLKRSSVPKPTKSLKRMTTVSTVTEKSSLKTKGLKTMGSLHPLTTEEKLKRAKQVKKSAAIAHFTYPDAPVVKQEHYLEGFRTDLQQPIEHTKSTVDKLVDNAIAKPAPNTKPLPKKQSKAIQAATLALPAIVLGLLVYGVTNSTSLEMKIVSNKTGFATSIPSYKPAGYKLQQLSYATGIFASEFKNSGNHQAYVITQKPTTWDNSALIANYISIDSSEYNKVNVGGKSVYFFGNGNAAWVSKGIWYQINSAGTLKESQLINIANSL